MWPGLFGQFANCFPCRDKLEACIIVRRGCKHMAMIEYLVWWAGLFAILKLMTPVSEHSPQLAVFGFVVLATAFTFLGSLIS